MGATR